MTLKNAFIVGAVFGWIIGTAGLAIRAFHRLRSHSALSVGERRRLQRQRAVGFALALVGLAVVVVAISLPPDISKLREGMFQGCRQRCTQDGGELSFCERYCSCYIEELVAVHGPRKLNSLVVAASRDRDGAAMATLAEQATKCAARM